MSGCSHWCQVNLMHSKSILWFLWCTRLTASGEIRLRFEQETLGAAHPRPLQHDLLSRIHKICIRQVSDPIPIIDSKMRIPGQPWEQDWTSRGLKKCVCNKREMIMTKLFYFVTDCCVKCFQICGRLNTPKKATDRLIKERRGILEVFQMWNKVPHYDGPAQKL